MCRERHPRASIADASSHSADHSKPATKGTLEDPDRSPQRCSGREDGLSGTPTSTHFSENDAPQRYQGKAMYGRPGQEQRWKQAELDDEPEGLGEAVIGLTDSLLREVLPGTRDACDEEVICTDIDTTGGPHSPNEFEVLEKGFRAVTISCKDRAPADPHRPWVIRAESPVQQCSAGIPPGMPGQAGEVVLRTNEICFRKKHQEMLQLGFTVPDVIIGYHDMLVPCCSQTCDNAMDFPIAAPAREVRIWPQVTNLRW